jgi:hypothetical protein
LEEEVSNLHVARKGTRHSQLGAITFILETHMWSLRTPSSTFVPVYHTWHGNSQLISEENIQEAVVIINPSEHVHSKFQHGELSALLSSREFEVLF